MGRTWSPEGGGDAISGGGSRSPSSTVYRFGPFELRSGIGQLTKHGVRLRLQLKPAQLLEALVESPGDLVTREALRQKLWPDGTFVDFEGSINTAINRLRAALNDCPENPRYIETVPRLGYRFIHSVLREETAEQKPANEGEPTVEPIVKVVNTARIAPTRPTFAKRKLWLAAVASLAAIALTYPLWTPLLGQMTGHIRPHFRQLIFDTGSIPTARFLPGTHVAAFTALQPGGKRASKTVEVGDLQTKPLDAAGTILSSVNSRGELAFVSNGQQHTSATGARLMAMNSQGNWTGKIADGVLAADWSPRNSDLAVARHEGALSVIEFPRGHPVFSTRGWVSDLRVSPRGDRVAFWEHPVRDDTGGAVEVVERSGKANRLTSLWSSASGLAWSPSGSEIWFSAGRDGITLSIYGVNLQGKVRDIFAGPSSVRLLDFSKTGEVLMTVDNTRMNMMSGTLGETGETDVSQFDYSHADAISADGRLLLFTECGSPVGRHYTAYLRNLQTGETTQLGAGRALALSADGTKAITIDPQDRTVLTMHDIASKTSRTLPNEGLQYQWARFLPGKTSEILVGGSHRNMPLAMYKQCTDAGTLDRVAAPVYLDNVVISSSGRQIAGTAEGRLRAFEWSTGRELPLPAQAGPVPLAWSADGLRLFAMDKEALEMSSIDIATGATEVWRDLAGRERTDFVCVASAVAAPDAGVYAYSLHLSSSRLYLVSGLS